MSKKRLPAHAFEATITGLSHEGRGIAELGGKKTFIDAALPGEQVRFRYTRQRGRLDEGVTEAVLHAAPERVDPRCPHYALCGGCSLQHFDANAQILHKQKVLLEQLRHIGSVLPVEVLPPLTGPVWGYRRKARLGVRWVDKKGGLLIGFRERSGRLLADIFQCDVLDPRIGQKLRALRVVLGNLSNSRHIAQIEVAMGDEQATLVIRHLEPFDEEDKNKLRELSRQEKITLYLQSGGLDTVTLFYPEDAVSLSYRLPAHNIVLRFLPNDFTQVNAEINRLMVDRAITLLAPQAHDRVLDLFCGLGNFTLPLARYAAHVTGVEGAEELVQRARTNAQSNGIHNVEFRPLDLAKEEQLQTQFPAGSFNKILLDPPRTGALEVIQALDFSLVESVVYVSCNPATLARDTRVLVERKGLKLQAAGVMDMFPHTTHVESIALFTRGK